MAIDRTKATSFADMAALMLAATSTIAGVAIWKPNRFLVGRGAEPLASDCTADALLQVCTDAMQQFPGAPGLVEVFVAASAAGQNAADAFGAVLQKATLFLFARDDHGGLREVEGLVAFPSAFLPPVRSPLAAAPTPPAPSSPQAAGLGDGSEQAAKRAKVDTGVGAGVELPSASEPATPPKGAALLTSLSASQQFTAEWATIMSYMQCFMNARFETDLVSLATKVGYTERSVTRCVELCCDNPTELGGELKVTKDLQEGIRLTMTYKQPQLVALYIHSELGAVTSQQQTRAEREAMQKRVSILLKSGKAKSGFDEFDGWNRDGSITPRALAPRQPRRRGGGGSGQNASPRGTGHYTPQPQHSGGQGSGRQHNGGRGRGGGRTGRPMCGRCTKDGLDPNHSYRECPQTICHKCGEPGHVTATCTSP